MFVEKKTKLSKARLLEIYGVKDSPQFTELYDCLMEYIDAYGIRDNYFRLAAFLAQVGYESGRFRFLEELSGGEQYEGRVDLGNLHQGDGARFKGRGLIQITGRYNYNLISQDFDVDFIGQPHLLATPQYAVLSALWYWDRHELNKLADVENFRAITKKINGGLNGHDQRVRLYSRAIYVLTR